MISLVSTIYTSSINLVIILLTVLGIIFLFKKPLYTFYIIVFTLPFKSFYLWIGTNLEIWKILSAAFFVFYGPFLLIRDYNNIKNNCFFHLLMFYIFYVLTLTIASYFTIPEYDKHLVSGGFFKNEGRIYFQMVLFFMTINLVLIPLYVINNREEIFQVLKIFVYAVLVLAILGIAQELSIRLLNYDPFPIYRPTGLDYIRGYVYVPGMEAVHRINSLAGEPKHLAIALVIGITIILLYRLNGMRIIKYDLLSLSLFLICLILTYSTTGYVWFAIIMLTIMFIYSFKMPKNLFLIVTITLLTMVVIYFFSGGLQSPYIRETISKVGLEVQDEAVLKSFLNNPLYSVTGYGLGNIHFYAMQYLPKYFPLFKDTPFKGNTGFFLLLGDVGLIGIITLTMLSVGLIKSNKQLFRMLQTETQDKARFLIHFSGITFFLFFLRYYEFFFVVIGVMLYLNNELMNNKRILSLQS
jgi:hypothetical protein